VVEAAIELSHWALRALMGIVEMSVFQTLSAGKTLQLVDGGKAALAWTVASWLSTSTVADKSGKRAMKVDTTIQ
jgi:hypothetical protein